MYRSPAFVIATLDAAETEHLAKLPPEPNGGIKEAGFVGIDQRSLPNEINLMGLQPLGLLEQLPDQEKRGNDDLHGIVRPESGDIPWLIGRVAIEDSDQNHPDKGSVSAERLETSKVREGATIKTLGFAGSVEADISN